MTTIHHVGLCVSDAERAGAFYIDALGARWLARPITFEGPGAEQAMGQQGVRLKLGLLGFGEAAVELFEFLAGPVPDWAQLPARGRLPHLGLQVPDTHAALTRIEAAGGRRLWDEVGRWGAAHVVYACDPDGNVIELLDRPASYVAQMLHRGFPESVPQDA